MGKVLDQSVIPVLRKIPKTARNITFLKTGNFDSFDRSLDTSATILKFDPFGVPGGQGEARYKAKVW